MQFSYTISLYIYLFLIRVASLFHPKAKEWIAGRKSEKWRNLQTNGRNVVWFHCASLGEFDQGLPLMEAWKESFPQDFLLVSFFSPSGMKNYHKRNHCADEVVYLPLDTPKNAREFCTAVDAKNVFFVKYEFWANHLREAKKSGANVYSVSAIFRKNQIYFKWYGIFNRTILKNFDHLFLQDENSKKLLETINIKNTTVCGDLRYDRVLQNKIKVSENEILKNFIGNEKAFIIGSSWPADENLIKDLLNDASFTQKVIFAPHEISNVHLNAIENLIHKKSIRYTELLNTQESSENYQILILDTIGHLTNAYQYGDKAYVGGGFSGGLHNILEPAVFGLPVFFGPKHSKFPEADIFVQQGFGFEIETVDQLISKFSYAQKNQTQIKIKLLAFMESQTGIAKKIMAQLLIE